MTLFPRFSILLTVWAVRGFGPNKRFSRCNGSGRKCFRAPVQMPHVSTCVPSIWIKGFKTTHFLGHSRSKRQRAFAKCCWVVLTPALPATLLEVRASLPMHLGFAHTGKQLLKAQNRHWLPVLPALEE